MRNTTYITALLITTTFSSFSQKETTKKYSKQSEPTVIEAPKEEGYQMGDHDPVPEQRDWRLGAAKRERAGQPDTAVSLS